MKTRIFESYFFPNFDVHILIIASLTNILFALYMNKHDQLPKYVQIP